MTTTVVGVTMDEGLAERIDRDRGDVARSRYVQRLVEQALVEMEKKKNDANST
jgi:metal-responsive CopG/Arc/MetJ family transcriptional regulator